MPVKRQAAKRRFTDSAEAAAWECTFDCGRDFFRDLADIGVEVDAFGLPDVDAVKQAWRRLGHIFLATRQPDPHRQPWALKTFGDPQCQ